MKMFASALSMREYEPGVELRYSEQTAMETIVAQLSILLPHSQIDDIKQPCM